MTGTIVLIPANSLVNGIKEKTQVIFNNEIATVLNVDDRVIVLDIDNQYYHLAEERGSELQFLAIQIRSELSLNNKLLIIHNTQWQEILNRKLVNVEVNFSIENYKTSTVAIINLPKPIILPKVYTEVDMKKAWENGWDSAMEATKMITEQKISTDEMIEYLTNKYKMNNQ